MPRASSATLTQPAATCKLLTLVNVTRALGEMDECVLVITFFSVQFVAIGSQFFTLIDTASCQSSSFETVLSQIFQLSRK